MNIKDACETLLKIEKSVDINSMRCQGAHLWPLVRQYLWVTLISTEPTISFDHSPSLKTSKLHVHFTRIKRKIKNKVQFSIKNLQLLWSTFFTETDLLFLSQQFYYSEKIDGKAYNRFIDPLFELFSDQYQCLKVENSNLIVNRLERKYQCLYFPIDRPSNKNRKEAKLAVNSAIKVLDQIAELASVDKRKLIRHLIGSLTSTIYYRCRYTALLKHLRPSVFFTTCYYFPSVMGLNWAAYNCKIPTVDIQHGKQGKYQGMYSHWTKIPEGGYAMLPAWFWLWGQESVENIMRWQYDRIAHRCVVGGYPWSSIWKKRFTFMQFASDVRKTYDKYRKIILITLQGPQGSHKDIFPDFIVEAIRISPKNWYWLIRNHPNYPKGKSIVKKKLETINDSKYDIDNASSNSLYELLSISCFHITAHSSVCYEAEVFSVPTIIFGEDGRNLYSKELEEGRFHFCDTAQEIIFTIENRVFTGGRLYIETDKKFALKSLKRVIESPLTFSGT